MKLLIGLGNPGKEYENTRHNAGFLLLDKISECLCSAVSWQKKFDGLFAETCLDGQKLLLLKPQTYMNRSGVSVAQVMNFYKIETKDILVLHDEIDFVTGRIAFKLGGSPAGHNGLKSIIEKIGTQDFARVRLGVDRPASPAFSVADYVLGKFSSHEWSLFEEKIPEIEKLVLDWVNKR